MGNVLIFPGEDDDESSEGGGPYYSVFDPNSPPELPKNWKRSALCASGDVDPDIFFPEHTDKSSAQAKAAQARLICAQCPVENECLTYALLHREKQGVWGGVTDKERNAMVRGRQTWRKCTQCGNLTFGQFYTCCRITHD